MRSAPRNDMIRPMLETVKGDVVSLRGIVLATALALTGSCSEASPKPGPETTTKTPPPTEPASSESALRDAFDALPASPPLLPPLEHQMGASYIESKLLGFTEDYRAYALEIEHNYAFDDGQGEFNLHMHQVFDTWTGEGIAAYEIEVEDTRGERFGDDSYHRSMQRFATQLESGREWKSWLAQNPLITLEAKRKTEKGEFSLELTGRAPLQSTMAISDRSFGFRVKWSNLPTAEAFEAQTKKKRRVPRLIASWTPKGAQALPSVSFRPEMAWVNWSGAAKNNATKMLIKAYPTPDDRRVLWLAQPQSSPRDSEHHDPSGRFFMRALGRQIKVVHAGSGVDPARRASAHLEANGVTITAISKQAKDTAVSGIYYRGDALDIAQNVQALLPGSLPIEQLQASGWVDVIIVLGQDVGPIRKRLKTWGAEATTALEAKAPVNLESVVQPATAATDNCPTVLIKALDGATLLDDVRLQEECEEAPDYSCEDDSEGCETTTYEIGEQLTIEGRPYQWVHTTYSMKGKEIGSSALYGYGCGKLAAVWSFTNRDQGDITTVELREGKNGLTAIMTEASSTGSEAASRKERLSWYPMECVYKPK